jgi:ribonuclease HI
MPLFKELKPLELVAHTDGACRGNPGPAAAAAVLAAGGVEIAARARFLGKATNNIAEYEALILALETAAELGADSLTVYTDSELIARQVRGAYKVKNPGLKPLHDKVKTLASRLGAFSIREIPREKNKTADGLANRAIDAGRDISE